MVDHREIDSNMGPVAGDRKPMTVALVGVGLIVLLMLAGVVAGLVYAIA
jgi:hypothetical protein